MSISPLPERLRPQTLNEYIGQNHLVGPGNIVNILLSKVNETNFFPSLVFWGPPGSGKTTLARIIAHELERDFFEFSAVSTSTKDIARVISSRHSHEGLPAQAGGNLFPAPVIFIDEIHRFNKAQQDKLLPHVERGDIVFIGATTENPSFEIISPLLSRSRVLVLKELKTEDLAELIKRGQKNST